MNSDLERVAMSSGSAMAELEELKSRFGEALNVLDEVMTWIENWSPEFTEDDEWQSTEARANVIRGWRSL